MAAWQPDLKVGEYTLVRLLGRGGMGDVWMASDTRADRPVALKFIKPHLLDDPGFRTRFLNEAKTLGRLEHDRIVTLYNVVEEGGHLALVLRFIDGTSLADRIDADGVLPNAFSLAVVRDILPALGFAHERGIIHRDIKPQNVLIDRQGRSFLTDFGIAVGDFAQRATVTGFAVGTPHYMSPEQIQRPRELSIQSGGHRSDIYSFGVVLFEMLTGRVPFGCDTEPEEMYKVQHAHCVEAPPPLRDVNPDIPAAVEAVVLRCLAKDPNERPQSCAELLAEFEGAVLSGPAPVAPRPNPARAKTVVERATPLSVPEPAVARQVVPPRRRSTIPKWAWLTTGGVLIAGGISYGVLTSSGKPDAAPPRTEKTVTDAKVPGGEGMRTEPPVPLKPKGGGTTAPPIDPGAAARAAEARKYYLQAMAFQQQKDYCSAETAAGEAVARDPSNPEYAPFKAAAGKACTEQRAATGYLEKANSLFRSGEYCEAKAAADEAVKRDPANGAFLRRQKELAGACTP